MLTENSNVLAPRITKEGNLFYPESLQQTTKPSWIWETLFGIPEPSFTPEPAKSKFMRWQIQILSRDFTVRTLILEGPDPCPMESNMRVSLQYLAYTDSNAVAFEVKGYFKSKLTGEFMHDDMFQCAAYRVDKNSWCWKNSKTSFEVSNPFR